MVIPSRRLVVWPRSGSTDRDERIAGRRSVGIGVAAQAEDIGAGHTRFAGQLSIGFDRESHRLVGRVLAALMTHAERGAPGNLIPGFVDAVGVG